MLHVMFTKTWYQFLSCTVRCFHEFNCNNRNHLYVGVKNLSLNVCGTYDVSHVDGKFQSCTVAIQVATTIYNKSMADIVVCVRI